MPFSTLTAEENSADLDLLSNTCLPSQRERGKTVALRPERPECAAYMQVSTHPRWTSALQYIQAGIHLEGESIEGFCSRFYKAFSHTPRALQSVAAILYDQECSGVLIPEAVKTLLDYRRRTCFRFRLGMGSRLLIRKILEVDYCAGDTGPLGGHGSPDWIGGRFIWPVVDEFCEHLVEFVNYCRRGQLPDKRSWELLGNLLSETDYCLRSGGNVSDIAIMLYYYQTHRRQLSPKEYIEGVTGYTGILQELEDEIPTKGPDRLMRKLSVDINYLIPSFVSNSHRRKAMIAAAKNIAAQHNLPVTFEANGSRLQKLELEPRSGMKVDAPPAYSP